VPCELTVGWFTGCGRVTYSHRACNFLAAQHLEFSTIYAITALNFPFVMIMAAFVLREPIDRFKVLGVTGIMVGLGIFLWL